MGTANRRRSSAPTVTGMVRDTFRYRPAIPAAGAMAIGSSAGVNPYAAPIAFSMAVIVLVVGWRCRGHTVPTISLLLAIMGAMAFRQSIQAEPGNEDPSRWSGQYVTVTGRLIDEPEAHNGIHIGTLAVGVVDGPNGITHRSNGLLRIALPMDASKQPPHIGDMVRLRGQIRRFRSPTNPGESGASALWERRGLFARLNASGTTAWSVIAIPRAPHYRLAAAALGLRSRTNAIFSAHMTSDQAGLINGLLLGGRSDLTGRRANELTRAGLAHIIAASGANIASIIGLVLLLLRWLRLGDRLTASVCILAASGYAVAAGSQPAVVRAAIMASIFVAAPLFNRCRDGASALCVAAIVALAIDPANIADPGFQLSFTIVAGMMAFWPSWSALLAHVLRKDIAASRSRRSIDIPIRMVLNGVALSVIAGMTAAPITLQIFNSTPVYGVWANLLVAPAVTAIVPIALLVLAFSHMAPALSGLLCHLILAPVAAFILNTATIFGGEPSSTLSTPSPSWPVVLISYGVLGGLAFAARRATWPIGR